MAALVTPASARESSATGGQIEVTPFDSWLSGLRQQALAEGLPPLLVTTALSGAAPLPRVIELDQAQPEGRLPTSVYMRRILTPAFKEQGQQKMLAHQATLRAVSQRWGVPAGVVVALWGIETRYGRLTGGFPVFGALTTLAYEGRRASYFRQELMQALRLAAQERLDPLQMTGSWAGAMGQVQFMPTTFIRFAVDGDGDGHRDIWRSTPDALASAANYLVAEGWQPGQGWGRRVKLPAKLPHGVIGLESTKTLAEWQRLGVRTSTGGALPQAAGLRASLIQPDGPGTSTWLVYPNFRVLMRWNRSTSFALTAGEMSDYLSGAGNGVKSTATKNKKTKQAHSKAARPKH
ncbi:MAG: lytic murein transglycosylase [Alphaproteobacteria bacterium]|nr:MAG: lytic murein transglycosylase [Alphaproteobacteria bacterium]